jgi:hypothetical protein
MTERPRIKSLTGSKPHPSWKGWRNFLATCEVRDKVGETVLYGKTNCNFILFPDGTLLENYGYNGKVVMNRIRKIGWKRVLRVFRKSHAIVQDLLSQLDRRA